MVILYSGTTGNYLTVKTPCIDKKITLIPLSIHMHNGEIIYSTHTALLSNLYLPLEAIRCQISPGLNKALAYIGVLYYHGCIAYFYDNKVIITKK